MKSDVLRHDLLTQLQLIPDQKERIHQILSFCYKNKIRYWKICKPFAEEALDLSNIIGYEVGRGLALLELGYQSWFSDSFDLASRYLEDSISILRKTDRYFMFGRAAAVHASILWGKGYRKEAITNSYKAFRHIRSFGKPGDSLWLEWFLGIFYNDLQDFENSEVQYNKALALIKASGKMLSDVRAYCKIGLGGIFMNTGRERQALDFFTEALEFCQKNELWMQEARALQEIGQYHKKKDNLKEAIHYFERSYQIRKTQDTKPALITSLLSIAEIRAQENIDSALELGHEALSLSQVIEIKYKIKACHELLSDLYKQKKNFKSSHFHLEEARLIAHTFQNEQSGAAIKNLETEFITEFLKSERDVLSVQNEELKRANQIIQMQYREISDSIQYAKKIQSAILPSVKTIEKYIPESFIFYEPKAVVAGDFYWLHPLKKNEFLVAVADCTGQGVPGAIISMVCINALRQAVCEHKLSSPAEILNKTRGIIVDTFDNSEDNIYDGMDISLCHFNSKTKRLKWVGAYNPAWIVRKGKMSIEKLQPNRQPIGMHVRYTPFTEHDIQLAKGDQIYLFSDGYADQFGGTRSKKYGYKRLEETIIRFSGYPIKNQKEHFKRDFESWKNEMEQTDDVCLMGIRF